MKKIVLILVMSIALILVACGKETIKPLSLVATDVIYLNEGTEAAVNVEVIPSDATDKTLVFEIGDTTIASLREHKVTGLKVGTTILKVSVKGHETVYKDITIYVVDKKWPNDDIEMLAGFKLPEFTDYTSVILDETVESILSLTIKGTKNPDQAMLDYKTLLTTLGWEVVGSFDSHMGELTHSDYTYNIKLHNNYEHQGDTIDLEIVKHGTDSDDEHDDHDHEHLTWTQLQAKVKLLFSVEIPFFDEVIEIHLTETTHTLTLSVESTNRQINIASFMEALSAAGFTIEGTATTHGGTYVKDGLSISYHENHDDTLVTDMVITTDSDHDHHHLTWAELQQQVKEIYQIDLPNFGEIIEIHLKDDTSAISFSVEANEREAKLLTFMEALMAAGFIPEGTPSTHLGTYIKDGVKVSYHEDHHDDNVIDFKISP